MQADKGNRYGAIVENSVWERMVGSRVMIKGWQATYGPPIDCSHD